MSLAPREHPALARPPLCEKGGEKPEVGKEALSLEKKLEKDLSMI